MEGAAGDTKSGWKAEGEGGKRAGAFAVVSLKGNGYGRLRRVRNDLEPFQQPWA